MIESLYKFGLKELGEGPNYNRHAIPKRKFSIFSEVAQILKPKIVVEIGSWEGASAVSWAEYVDKVICVDTWLGSVEHYENVFGIPTDSGIQKADMSGSEWERNRLMIEDGYPTIFKTFADNVRKNGYQNKIIPITIDSNQSYIILEKSGIDIDVIYIDAAHDYHSVMNDVKKSYNLIKNKGHVCGDDYFGEIQKAVNDFAYLNNLRILSKENQYILFDQFDNSFDNFVQLGWQ